MGTPSTRLPVPAPSRLAGAGYGRPGVALYSLGESLGCSDPKVGARGGAAACRLIWDLGVKILTAGLPPNLCGRIRYGFDLTGCPVRVWRKVCDMFRLVWLDGVLGSCS